MLPPKLGSHAFFKIRNPIRNPELELDPNPRSGAPKNRIFEKLSAHVIGKVLLLLFCTSISRVTFYFGEKV